MKNEVIDLIKNKKLKDIALNGGDIKLAISITNKVKPKSESDRHAQAALIWEMKGERLHSEQCAKQALAVHTLENIIHLKPEHSCAASIWYQLNALKSIAGRVNSVFGENAFDSIDIYFKKRF